MPRLPASALDALLRVRFGEGGLQEVLTRLAHVARETLPGAHEVSVTLVRGERPFTAAYTGQLALDADELQYARGYGPCIDAGLSGQVLRIDDMRTETRWPDYTSRVIGSGVLSSLSMPLPLQTHVVGALNIYATVPYAFEADQEALAGELAGYLAVSTANALLHADATREAEEMRGAMATRAVIEQAIGVVMALERCDAEAAFAVLRRASQGRNVKLREVAADMVARVSRGR
jgi:GAF domain-containing protein